MRSTMKQRSINTDHRLATIGAKVDPVFHKKVKEFTFRNNMSIAYLLEMAITEFIDRHEKESELEAEGERTREVSQSANTAARTAH